MNDVSYYKKSDVVAIFSVSTRQVDLWYKKRYFKKVGHGLYDKASVDKFYSELEERKKISPPEWLNGGRGD